MIVMKKAIILHGRPSKSGYYDRKQDSPSNAHWLPWVQEELLINDILAQTPELPKPYKPNYQEWLKVFNQLAPDKGTLLIGHSTGAGFIIRWLSENKTKVDKVILVAPFLDPRNTIGNNFFQFEFDKHMVQRTKGLTIFYSDNDGKDIQDSINILKDNLRGIKYKKFHNYGHFTLNDLKTRKFPELLKEVLK